MQEVTRVLVDSSVKVLAGRTDAFKFKIGRLTAINGMLFRGKVGIKPESKVPYIHCELNVSRAKRD